MEQEYEYLTHHGRRIFNAVYDQEKKEADFQAQELIKELLRIFHTETVSSVRENGKVPDISSLMKEVRTAVSQGILMEALELSENQKQVFKAAHDSFPVRNAVNASRKKVEDIFRSFQDHGADAATGYIKRLLEESRGETNAFKAQAEEALRKQADLEAEKEGLVEERDRLARKAEMTVKETLRAIRRNKTLEQSLADKTAAMELLDQEILSSKEANLRLTEERGGLLQEIAIISDNLAELTQRTMGYEADIQEQTSALEAANAQIEALGIEVKNGEASKRLIGIIVEKLRRFDIDGETDAQRLASVFQELTELRKKNSWFTQLAQKYEAAKELNEALIGKLREQEGLFRQAKVESILDENESVSELLIEEYYRCIKEYFIILLREEPKRAKNDAVLNGHSGKLHGLFTALRTRSLDPLELWERHLKTLKQSIKQSDVLRKYDIAIFTIEKVYKDMIALLGDFEQKRAASAIHLYRKMAVDEEVVI